MQIIGGDVDAVVRRQQQIIQWLLNIYVSRPIFKMMIGISWVISTLRSNRKHVVVINIHIFVVTLLGGFKLLSPTDLHEYNFLLLSKHQCSKQILRHRKIYCCYELIRVITIMLDKMEIRNKSIYNTLYWNRWFIIVAGILI